MERGSRRNTANRYVLRVDVIKKCPPHNLSDVTVERVMTVRSVSVSGVDEHQDVSE